MPAKGEFSEGAGESCHSQFSRSPWNVWSCPPTPGTKSMYYWKGNSASWGCCSLCLRTLSPFATVLESWAQEAESRQHTLLSLKWINVFFFPHGNKLTSCELVCCKCKSSSTMCTFPAFQHRRHHPKALTRHQCQVLGLSGLYKSEQNQLLFFISPSVSGILLLCCSIQNTWQRVRHLASVPLSWLTSLMLSFACKTPKHLPPLFQISLVPLDAPST